MCCIFTCCGWMIDLVQRLVTFTMSCCISSAVCCALLVSSMAGIGLGYNYSLAEYVDLKETNVSVYLKRGMFDDEVGDAMNWRRSGSNPNAGPREGDQIGDDNWSTTPEIGRRRLDNAIFESDDTNKYEGHLFKLTAKPPASTTVVTFTPAKNEEIDTIHKYPKESVDQIKAIQSYINMKKAAANARRTNKLPLLPEESAIQNTQYNQPDAVQIYPDEVRKNQLELEKNDKQSRAKDKKINPLRLAVPDPAMLTFDNWVWPKLSSKDRKKILSEAEVDGNRYLENLLTKTDYPQPVTPQFRAARPTRPRTTESIRTTIYHTLTRSHKSLEKDMDKELRMYKEKLKHENNKFDMKHLKEEHQNLNSKNDDYDEDSIGLSVRRKRNAIIKTSGVPTEKNSNSATSVIFAMDDAQKLLKLFKIHRVEEDNTKETEKPLLTSSHLPNIDFDSSVSVIFRKLKFLETSTI